MMNDNRFKVLEDGITKEYIVVKFCNNEDNGKKYLIYKEEDDDKLYGSLITLEDGKFTLDEIKDDSEWDYLDKELGKDEWNK